MKVLMVPLEQDIAGSSESGIKRVCEAYYKYLPAHGVQFVDRKSECDVAVTHAGIGGKNCDVAILHGIYWTADYPAQSWEYEANKNITEAVRSARMITVPSEWVAETIRRDLRVNPIIIQHGIEAEKWAHRYKHEGYVLWNKNRNADVCDPAPMAYLAKKFTGVNFVTTYSPDRSIKNIHEIGTVSHEEMKGLIQKAGAYLSTTKETFGIGVLEAMASGVPVLGFDFGGNRDLVEHGVTGYLAEPGNYEQLYEGLAYCMKYRSVLSANSIEVVKKWTWDKPIEKLYGVLVAATATEPTSVAVIIPLYNYADRVGKAVDSVLAQTMPVNEIIVVDDGSSDNPEKALAGYIQKNQIKLIRKPNGGVATARNRGISEAKSKYVCCLDADDQIDPEFIRTCVSELEADKTIGIAYTRLKWIDGEGKTGTSAWPDRFNYDRQLERANQIPTCCVFRREMWERLGGYKQRYAPLGAGSEDAEFWLRAGAYGYNARLVGNSPMFIYSVGSGYVSGNKSYRETDWHAWHPWTKDKEHPFASLATPKKLSHPVRQYDQPAVSVIIPVGEGHENVLENALDSLEAQTMRKWEVIVVWDSPHPYVAFEKHKAYPYIRLLYTPKPKSGPGVARNLGAKKARGGFLLFLDADDWLTPDALDTMISIWQQKETIVYSDYYGKIQVASKEDAEKLGSKVVDYNGRVGEAIVRHHSADYDCELAQRQPTREKLYHWCLVTCLIPKLWHDEIGGFDETMESFEDVDYHWRMARRGYCYTRIEEPLVVYSFITGSRRENASPYSEDTRQRAVSLLEYMLKKYKDIPTMPCFKCGQNQPVQRPYYPQTAERSSTLNTMSDEAFVKCRYSHPNKGDHRVIGPATKTDYGYRSGGDIMLVYKDDVRSAPHLFVVIEDSGGKVVAPKEEKTTAPPERISKSPKQESESAQKIADEMPEVEVEKEVPRTPSVVAFDPSLLPGVTPAVSREIKKAGVKSYKQIVELGVDGLMKINGIGKSRAGIILKYAEEKAKEEDAA